MTATILDEILAHKRAEVAGRAARRPARDVAAAAETAPQPPDFAAALGASGLSVIAEIKGASPSAGTIADRCDPVAIARVFEAAGAAALSVLTDAKYFRGSWETLAAVAGAVRTPVLCKEFIVDPYQIDEARASGAAAVLLIAGALEGRSLRAHLEHARRRGLAVLVEVHTPDEVALALDAEARVIGINNRDLRTLRVDLGTTARLRPIIPPGVLVVSESGFETREQVAAVERAGVDAILVGTSLMRSPDPGAKLKELRGR